MRILGIDPGSKCGYSVILYNKDSRELNLLDFGVIDVSKEHSHDRLLILWESLNEIARENKVNSLAIESAIYYGSFKATARLSEIRGISILLAKTYDMSIMEFQPTWIKKQIADDGRASKEVMIEAILDILNVDLDISSDSADAIAMALCMLSSEIGANNND